MYLLYVMNANVIYTSSINRTNMLPNAIAFDLDETLGSFSDFHSIWSRLEIDMQTQSTFNEILDLYPEFLRVGIFPVLRYIKGKQDSGRCLPIFIYTNNQCEDLSWIYKLIYYLELKLCPDNPVKIFARPILAFKINGKRIEPNRTSHEKTYSDFVKCSMLSTSHEICFIDDIYYSKMKHRRVYYIQPPPYVHSTSDREVINRFISSDLHKKLYPDRTLYSASGYTSSQFIPKIDALSVKEEQKITNRIMYFIREFFLISSRKRVTRKRVTRIGNFSRKKRSTRNPSKCDNN